MYETEAEQPGSSRRWFKTKDDWWMGALWCCAGCGAQRADSPPSEEGSSRCRECALAAGEDRDWFEADEVEEAEARALFDDPEELARGEWAGPGMYGAKRTRYAVTEPVRMPSWWMVGGPWGEAGGPA